MLELGTPKLGFLVTSGNIDSMVNHYTVNKNRRNKNRRKYNFCNSATIEQKNRNRLR